MKWIISVMETPYEIEIHTGFEFSLAKPALLYRYERRDKVWLRINERLQGNYFLTAKRAMSLFWQ